MHRQVLDKYVPNLLGHTVTQEIETFQGKEKTRLVKTILYNFFVLIFQTIACCL